VPNYRREFSCEPRLRSDLAAQTRLSSTLTTWTSSGKWFDEALLIHWKRSQSRIQACGAQARLRSEQDKKEREERHGRNQNPLIGPRKNQLRHRLTRSPRLPLSTFGQGITFPGGLKNCCKRFINRRTVSLIRSSSVSSGGFTTQRSKVVIARM
jgi:hypothetical protein